MKKNHPFDVCRRCALTTLRRQPSLAEWYARLRAVLPPLALEVDVSSSERACASLERTQRGSQAVPFSDASADPDLVNDVAAAAAEDLFIDLDAALEDAPATVRSTETPPSAAKELLRRIFDDLDDSEAAPGCVCVCV